MAVPYTFATATSAIPLSNLDSNFATAITLGSTATYLGNTTTTIAGLTLTSPTLTTPALGTPSSGVLTNCTGYPASAVSGTLPVANGGTGVTTSTGTGNVVLSTTPTLVTPILGTPTSGTLTNTTGFPAANLAGTALPSAIVTSSLTAVGTIATGVWNGTTIAIANGGTGQTTASAGFNALSPITTTGDLIIGNGTNSATRLAIGANTYVLTSNGTTASWVAPSGGGSQATATALGTVYASTLNTGVTTALGYQSAASSTSNGTTSIGFQALYNQTSSSTVNTAVGYQAGYSLTTGSGSNVFVGATAGYYVTGTNNTALGYACLANNNSGATGSYNTAVGSSSLASNTTASYNTAVGYQAGYYQTGAQNTAVGVYALYGASGSSTGTGNTAVGYNSENAVTTGGYNVAFGRSTHSQLTTGSYNVCLGHGSGEAVASGTYCIAIGYGAVHSGSAVNYELVIGTNAPTGKGSSTGFINPASGGVYQGNNSAAWSVSSDQRLKKNIVDNNVGLDKVIQIQVRNFEYRTEDEVTDLPKNQAIAKQGVQLGVIAQELQQVLPDCVKQESTGVLAVDSTDIMYHMINAIKELNAEITALKAKVGI